MKMEDKLIFVLKNKNDNILKNGRQAQKNGRRPQKIKDGRRPQNKKWKTNQSTKINLIGCDTIVNSPSLSSFSSFFSQKGLSQGSKIFNWLLSHKNRRIPTKQKNSAPVPLWGQLFVF
jgi:hypothetical protein